MKLLVEMTTICVVDEVEKEPLDDEDDKKLAAEEPWPGRHRARRLMRRWSRSQPRAGSRQNRNRPNLELELLLLLDTC